MLDTVAQSVAALFALFTYQTDMQQYNVPDDQRSHVREVLQGIPFKDDCDGFALTAVDLLRRNGKVAWPVIVSSPYFKGTSTHMIAVFEDKNHQKFVVDNRYPGVQPYAKAMVGYRYVMSVFYHSKIGRLTEPSHLTAKE